MDSELPFDAITEILSRTSLKSLDTLRCTSNEIDKLTYNSYFLDQYKQRNKIISGFLVQDHKYWTYKQRFVPSRYSNTLDLSFLPSDTRIVASSEQGIIVFVTNNFCDYKKALFHVCKPSTKQVLALPKPKTKYFTIKVALIVLGSTPLHYKIVRLSKPKEFVVFQGEKKYMMLHCEIFDSLTGRWRLAQPVLLGDRDFPTAQPPITTRGSIYMLTMNNNILEFDTNLEKWTTFSSPLASMDYPSDTISQKLVKYEGKLAFACGTWNGGWETWVRKIDESWEKLCVFKADKEIKSLDALYDSDTSVMMGVYNDVVFYNFKREGVIQKINLRYEANKEMFVFRSDFETVELTRGHRKLELIERNAN